MKKTCIRSAKNAVFALLVCALCLFSGCGAKPAPAATAPPPSLPPASATATPAAPRDSRAIVQDLAMSYGRDGAAAEEKVGALLCELKSVDADAAARWEQVLTLWRSCGKSYPIRYDDLPEGLDDTDALAIVVLGFQLNPDGSMRDELLGRLSVALTCAEQYPNACVVCTGGPTASDAPDATEAGRMAEWLLARGLAPERVLAEDRSLSTLENAVKTLDMLASERPQVTQLCIVTSDYHVPSGVLLFAADGVFRAERPDLPDFTVVASAAWRADSGMLPGMYQAGSLLRLYETHQNK